MVGNGPRDTGYMITAHSSAKAIRASSCLHKERRRLRGGVHAGTYVWMFRQNFSAERQEHGPADPSSCSPYFSGLQVLPESLLRIAGMHENGIPAKICSEALCFSLLPPPLGRTPDSQRASGRIFLFCIRPFLAGARSSWSCTAEKDGISSPNKKSGHIFPGKAGFVRTPAWCRGGWLPCRLLFSGAGEKTI